MASINKITVGGVVYDITIPSGLSEEVQKQIRDNIGALSEADVNVVADGTYPEMTVGTAYNAQNDGNGDNIAATYVKLNELLNKVYPVESVYISTGATSPASIFGGTWTQIEGRFLLGAGGVYALGSMGGNAMHTNTIAEMASHTHDEQVNDGSTSGWYKVIMANGSGDGGYGENNATFRLDTKTTATGNGQPFSIMPPYLAVNIWKRIA
jgi:hypothetical protein